MRIIEVRDGFIKLETSCDLALSSFLEVKDVDKTYIAQVQQIKKAGDIIIAYAKCLFLYDGDLYEYDKTLPSVKAEIKEFSFKDLSKFFNYKEPIIVGSFSENGSTICIEKNFFNKKTLINFDDNKNINFILKNLSKQFDNSIIIDSLGTIDGDKFVAGADFKLPLNTEALEFLYEDCLNDATQDSKALIKEIFQDLSNYSKSVPFLPFGTLKTIVEDMVDKSHIFKLLVLKNKLVKFDKLGYFAKTENDAKNLDKILSSKNVILDLSKLDPIFLNRYLSVICNKIEKNENKTQVFCCVSNSINKKNLKNLIMGDLSSTILANSRFKYLNEIKSMFTNFIVEPNFSNNEMFKKVSNILPQLRKDNYLIIGEGTNYIQFVSNFVDFKEQNMQNFAVQENELLESIEESEVQESDVSENNNETLSEDEEYFEEIAVLDDEPVIEDAKSDALLAIDKKSDELIERISEEVNLEESSFNEEIFSDNEEDSDNNESITKIEDPELSGFSETYHTQVDNTKIVEVSEDVVEFVEQEENEEKNKANTLTEVDKALDEVVLIENEDLISKAVLDEMNVESDDLILQEDILQENQVEDTIENSLIDSNENLVLNEDYVELEAENAELSEINEINLEESNYIDIEDNAVEPIQEIDNDFIEDIIEVSSDLSEDIEDSFLDSIEDVQEEGFIEDTTGEVQEFEQSLDSNLSVETNVYEEFEEIEEIVDFNDDDISEDMIVVDMDDSEDVLIEDLDKEIIEDVDKVFTTIKEDTISDADLDFIDELNSSVNDEEGLELSDNLEELTDYQDLEDAEDGFLEPLEEINEYSTPDDLGKEILETKSATTPMVPVYGADIPSEDIVESDPIDQGDNVHHAKYGNGVVEKMIKYGSKTLYSINFENVGRRLLDPTLTEIKKV